MNIKPLDGLWMIIVNVRDISPEPFQRYNNKPGCSCTQSDELHVLCELGNGQLVWEIMSITDPCWISFDILIYTYWPFIQPAHRSFQLTVTWKWCKHKLFPFELTGNMMNDLFIVIWQNAVLGILANLGQPRVSCQGNTTFTHTCSRDLVKCVC